MPPSISNPLFVSQPGLEFTSDTDQTVMADRSASGQQPDFATPTGTLPTGSVPSGPITASGLTMNTNRLLGRTTAGVGAIEEITVAGTLTYAGGVLTGTAAAGADYLALLVFF
jgi:hypothetical protein